MTAHHVCIQTDNYAASLDFYTRLLGMRVVSQTENFHGRAFNTWLQAPDGFLIELQTPKAGCVFAPEDKERCGIAHLCFLEPELTAFCRRLEEQGFHDFRRKNGAVVYEVLGGKLCKLNAPEGTVLEFRDRAEL